ncbi:hypothetical protein [Natronorubrum texcoconense]|uniref:hypothetical protein n=1 Tax=Natronorubrum texcoconense TaxID=1095776 RepID=UPI000B7FB611|nr:hypothetical protein [Natronorubrum texcoconense]
MSGDVPSSNESRGYGGGAIGISGFVGLVVPHVVQHDRRQRLSAADDRLQLRQFRAVGVGRRRRPTRYAGPVRQPEPASVGISTVLIGGSYCRDLL